jgi:hypothetical protein
MSLPHVMTPIRIGAFSSARAPSDSATVERAAAAKVTAAGHIERHIRTSSSGLLKLRPPYLSALTLAIARPS